MLKPIDDLFESTTNEEEFQRASSASDIKYVVSLVVVIEE
jgi:hypothetical protein